MKMALKFVDKRVLAMIKYESKSGEAVKRLPKSIVELFGKRSGNVAKLRFIVNKPLKAKFAATRGHSSVG